MVEIITAVIAAVAAVIGSAFVQSKQTAVLEAKLAALKEELQVLSARVDKHNQLQERVQKNECEIAGLQREMDRK